MQVICKRDILIYIEMLTFLVVSRCEIMAPNRSSDLLFYLFFSSSLLIKALIFFISEYSNLDLFFALFSLLLMLPVIILLRIFICLPSLDGFFKYIYWCLPWVLAVVVGNLDQLPSPVPICNEACGFWFLLFLVEESK